jgi:hypothetical protein
MRVIDENGSDARDVDHDPRVARRIPAVAMAAAPHGDADVVRLRPPNGVGDVAGARAVDDGERVDAVEPWAVKAASSIVGAGAGPDDRSADP